MGLTLAKCPSCGAELNLEIDRDYFYCPHCGSKVLQQDNRIVIEHINRTVDEAEVRRVELEERKRIDAKEKQAKEFENMGRIGKVLTAICCVVFVLSYFVGDSSSSVIRFISAELGVVSILYWAVGGKKKR